MASREEFQAYMKATANEIEGSKRPCPGTEELIAYYRSLGNDSTREAIASHLSLCGNCRQTLVDLRDFFDPAPDDSAGAPDLDREWNRFAAANAAGRRESAVVTPIRPVPRTAPARIPRTALAWAAVLTVVTLASVLWTFWTQRRVHAELAVSQNRILRLEQENRSLRTGQENSLAALSAPRMDAAIFDLYSRASLDRSGGKRVTNRVRLAADAPAVFILNGEGQPQFPAYAVEILNGQARPVWRGDSLKRAAQGNYVISFPPGFFREGEYRMEVFGIQNGAKTKVAQYDLSVTGNRP